MLAGFDDAWDANEDNIYKMTAVDTDNPDAVAGSTDFEYRVTPNDAMLVEASAPAALTTFTIYGPDTVMSEINEFTGEVTLQDWFVPEPGENWDADENGTYVLTVTATAPNGTVTDTPASLTVTPTGEYIFDVPAPIILPKPETVDPDPVPFGTLFSLSGDDAVVLQIDEITGAITLNDWFTPDPGDSWDADEDGIYDFNIVTTAPDGTVVTTPATLTQSTDGTFMVNAPTIDVLPDDSGPVDPPFTGTELLTNGLLEGGVAFESNDSDGDVDGWATSSGTVDVWGDDSLTSDAGINILDGGVGDDVVIGGAGGDVLFDSFGIDTHEGGAGVDTVDIGGSTAGEADYNIDLTVGQDQYGNTYSNIENVTTGSGDDDLFGNAADNQLQGNDGDDSLVGNLDDNALNGGVGDDTLTGGGGDDTLTGGLGDDVFTMDNDAGSIEVTDFTQGAYQIDLSNIAGVEDFDDLVAFLLSGGGTSTLTFDITEGDQLQLIIQAEEDLEASDFIF